MCRPRSLVVTVFALAAAGLTHAAAPPGLLVDLYGDPLPPGAVARLGTVRWRSPIRISACGFVADGKHVATAHGADLGDQDPSRGSALSLWDLKTGRLVRTIREQVTPFRNGLAGGLAFTPDGARVLSADALFEKEGAGLDLEDRHPGLFLWVVLCATCCGIHTT
jgi:hypothetical protein